MHALKAAWLILIAYAVSMAGERDLWAGSMTYTWAATSSGSILEYVGFDPSGNLIVKDLALGSGVVRLTYSPEQDPGLTGSVSGDTAYFQTSCFEFSISVGPGYFGHAVNYANLELIAPPPGGGLDVMIFHEIEDEFHQTGIGTLAIFAPNGTLTTLSQLPANLDAFANYSLDHPGGNFDYTPTWTNTFPFYVGSVVGVLGSVPEPSTIVSMTIGMSLPLCLAVVRQRRRRRVGRRGPT